MTVMVWSMVQCLWWLVVGSWGRLYVLLPNDLPGAQQTSVLNRNSRLQCAHACDIQPGCQAFTWSEAQGVSCVTLTVLMGYKGGPTAGLSTYITTTIGNSTPVYLSGVNTWSNASAQCQTSSGSLLTPPLDQVIVNQVASFGYVVYVGACVASDSTVRDKNNNLIVLNGMWANNQPNGPTGRQGECVALTNAGYYTQAPSVASSNTAALCLLP